jgi:hypothetical protein
VPYAYIDDELMKARLVRRCIQNTHDE